MLSFLENQRVFKQESNPKDRYIVVPKDRVEEYYCFDYVVGILKGDVLYPNKWIQFGVNTSSYVKKQEFCKDDYEYLFSPEKYHIREIQKVLKQHSSIELNESFEVFYQLPSLPKKAESQLHLLLREDGNMEVESFLVEVVKYEKEGKDHILNLNSEMTDDGISYECTNDFFKKVIVSEYQNENQRLYKTIPEDIKTAIYVSQTNWYVVSSQDPDYPFVIINEIWDIEDILPFTNFQLTKSDN